ncbi:hypothetical protein Golax_018478, partial [Gossypium laxum]|nr:hypothetical protein [Gossypium laxum]
MLGGNEGNPMLPICMDENGLPYQTNASNQLQLFGRLPVGSTVDVVNYFGNEHLAPMVPPNKRGHETEDILRQQKLQISLNYKIYKEEADCSASIPNPHAVSTGLRLSYDDDERNSSEEFLTKGIRDMKQRHTASFLAAIEKGVSKKLREKDVELETVNRKNRELVDRIKQVTMEAQNWHHRAKYNESVVNVLKSNLQQVMSQSQGGEQQGKEGFGESEVDDAASYIDPNNLLSIPDVGGAKCVSRNRHGMICRACNAKEVSVLLMPCRHLCICKDCDVLISVCPVCQ